MNQRARYNYILFIRDSPYRPRHPQAESKRMEIYIACMCTTKTSRSSQFSHKAEFQKKKKIDQKRQRRSLYPTKGNNATIRYNNSKHLCPKYRGYQNIKSIKNL